MTDLASVFSSRIRPLAPRIVIPLLVLTWAATAHADPFELYNNGEPALTRGGFFLSPSCMSPTNCPFETRIADDFLLTSDGVLNSIQFWTMTPFDSGGSGQINVIMYDVLLDDGGIRTSLGSGFGLITQDAYTGRWGGDLEHDRLKERVVNFDLAVALTLTAGQRYWLSMGAGNFEVTRPPSWEGTADSGYAFILNGQTGGVTTVPDGGSTVTLLGSALFAFGLLLRRRR